MPLKKPATALHIERTTPQALEAKLPIALKALDATPLTALNIPPKNPATAFHTPTSTFQAETAKSPIALNTVETIPLTASNIPPNQAE